MPAAIPVTSPELLIVAVNVLVLLHAPPVVASLSEVVEPAQTNEIPDIEAGARGKGLTVITAVIAALPQLLETV